MIYIKFKKLVEDAIIPNYATKNDAGMDLYSVEEKKLRPLERALFSTGIVWEPVVESGKVYMKIEDKSGLAIKNGISVLGGVIDQEYRGEIKVILINLSGTNVFIKKGDKIAQGIVYTIPETEAEEVQSLNENTERGDGGFGSTGN